MLDPAEIISITQQDAYQRSMAAFEAVFVDGTKIELDHHLVYYAREFILSIS